MIKSGQRSDPYCVLCKDLVTGPPQFQDNEFGGIVKKKFTNGKEYCCASNDDNFSTFYQKVCMNIRGIWSTYCIYHHDDDRLQ